MKTSEKYTKIFFFSKKLPLLSPLTQTPPKKINQYLVICSLCTELICVHMELAVENFLWQFWQVKCLAF